MQAGNSQCKVVSKVSSFSFDLILNPRLVRHLTQETIHASQLMLSKADRETITLEHLEQCYYLKIVLRGACHVNSVLIMSVSHYTRREALGVVCAPSLSGRLLLYSMLSSCFATVTESILS